MEDVFLYIAMGLAVLYVLLTAFYYFFQERLLFVPLQKQVGKGKLLVPHDYSELFLNTDGGGRIHAVHMRVKNPRGCILYFHGNTKSMPRWAPIAEELTSFGFDVFLPDYRGYGQSTGPRNEAAFYSDAMACYHQVLESYPSGKICIYGRSLGSGMAAWLSGQVEAGAVVLETPYKNMGDVANHHARIFPVRWLLRYRFRNDLFLKNAKAPVLIAHGTKDKIVPYRSSLGLYQEVKPHCKVEMLTIPGGHHGDLNGFPVFRKTLERFFDRYFPKG